jgi:uncharacterized protein (DUF3084 family)
MINEDLLDPKDVKIFKLEKLIEKFKAYDEERKKYYSDALIELGILRSELDELRDESKTVKKVLNLRNENERLRTIINKHKLSEELDLQEVNIIKLNEQIKSLQSENNKLKKSNTQLIKDNNYLVYKLYHENNS